MPKNKGHAADKKQVSFNQGQKTETHSIPVSSKTKGKIHPVVIFPYSWRKGNKYLPSGIPDASSQNIDSIISLRKR